MKVKRMSMDLSSQYSITSLGRQEALNGLTAGWRGGKTRELGVLLPEWAPAGGPP